MVLRKITHAALVIDFIESIQMVMKDIDKENIRLKKAKDYDELTQVHKTLVILRRYFNNHGGIAL